MSGRYVPSFTTVGFLHSFVYLILLESRLSPLLSTSLYWYITKYRGYIWKSIIAFHLFPDIRIKVNPSFPEPTNPIRDVCVKSSLFWILRLSSTVGVSSYLPFSSKVLSSLPLTSFDFLSSYLRGYFNAGHRSFSLCVYWSSFFYLRMIYITYKWRSFIR